LAKEKKPSIVFLMETKVCGKKMEWVQIQLGFEQMLVVDCVGKGGGLALLWMTDFGEEIQNYSCQHINVKVCSFPTNSVWKFMGFCGHPDTSKRPEAWSLLLQIARMDPSPWVYLGDFNEILSLDEKNWRERMPKGFDGKFSKYLEGVWSIGFGL
jgi:hypothetical protein